VAKPKAASTKVSIHVKRSKKMDKTNRGSVHKKFIVRIYQNLALTCSPGLAGINWESRKSLPSRDNADGDSGRVPAINVIKAIIDSLR